MSLMECLSDILHKLLDLSVHYFLKRCAPQVHFPETSRSYGISPSEDRTFSVQKGIPLTASCKRATQSAVFTDVKLDNFVPFPHTEVKTPFYFCICEILNSLSRVHQYAFTRPYIKEADLSCHDGGKS